MVRPGVFHYRLGQFFDRKGSDFGGSSEEKAPLDPFPMLWTRAQGQY